MVTFLFTDVEGSTRRWEADADAMRAPSPPMTRCCAGRSRRTGAGLFKHTGDGVCAAFASPQSAVDAAVAAQRALELPVRMGVATGEAELRDGGLLRSGAESCGAGDGRRARRPDPVGRVDGGSADRSRPSRSGAATVAGSADAGAGLPGPSQGLRTEFPPLRALDTSPGNLRRAATSFIGRESEVGEVLAAVRAHRLVTLTGVGGVGKTRLALEVAARLRR